MKSDFSTTISSPKESESNNIIKRITVNPI